MASLYEQNSSVITTFIKSTLGKTLLGIVALLIAAAGITVPMCAIDNTNELQDEWIYAVEAKADANASAITANARAIEALNMGNIL
jgi:phage tail sheath gpL-like